MTETKNKQQLRQPPKKKWHGPCIYKIREVTSPLHKEFRGYRMLVAIPNMNGHEAFSDTPAPSFTRAYLLFQSSDYNGSEIQAKVQQHITWLKNRGFTTVEDADTYKERMLQEMSKGHLRDQHETDILDLTEALSQ